MRPRNRGLPRWYNGKKRNDDITGEESYERDMTKQRGLWIRPENIDSVTEEQRQKAIKRRMR